MGCFICDPPLQKEGSNSVMSHIILLINKRNWKKNAVARNVLKMVSPGIYVIHRGSRSTEVGRYTEWESAGLYRNHRFDTGTVAHLES